MKAENWIKWDLDSRLGLRMSAYFADHGTNGYGFFLFLVEILYRADGNRLPHANMQTYAKLCKIMQTDANAYMGSLLEIGLLLSDGEHFWSPRVNEEISLRKLQKSEISEKRRAAAESRWNKSNSLQGCKPMQIDANACKPMQTHANDARGEEKRREKKREDQNISTSPRQAQATKRGSIENKTEFAPGVWLTQDEHSKFLEKFGPQFVSRCCEKLSAWIEQDPIPKRKRNGVNAAATFRAWVLNSVSEEEARAARLPPPAEKKLYGKDLVRDMEERLARGETI